jgi:hypothetical protein
LKLWGSRHGQNCLRNCLRSVRENCAGPRGLKEGPASGATAFRAPGRGLRGRPKPGLLTLTGYSCNL